MKLLIRENCSYRSDEFKKDSIVEVGEETGKVLLRFNYAKEIEDPEKDANDPVVKNSTKKVTQKSKQEAAGKVSDG